MSILKFLLDNHCYWDIFWVASARVPLTDRSNPVSTANGIRFMPIFFFPICETVLHFVTSELLGIICQISMFKESSHEDKGRRKSWSELSLTSHFFFGTCSSPGRPTPLHP